MRLNTLAARFVVAVGAVLCVVSDAEAQSFFQSLFGGGSKKPVVRGPQQVRHMNPRHLNMHRSAVSRRNQSAAAMRHRRSRSGGRYRTMCVRMCDGYYFPVSSKVGRNKFSRDSRTCKSRCGEEAKLFYHSAGTGKVDSMVDLSGRRYKSLDVAFRYRKNLVKGCACRPSPWSFAERARHQGYAAKIELAELDQGGGGVTNAVVAGVYEETKKPDNIDLTVGDQDATGAADDQSSTIEQSDTVTTAASIRDDLPFVAMKRRSSARAHNDARQKRKRRKAKERTVARARKRPNAPRRSPSKKKQTGFSFFAPSPGKYRYPGD